jgi:hypothetical protein
VSIALDAQNPDTMPARRLWAAVTIRVAWELYRQGIRPSGAILHDAREHALLSIPDSVDREQAEELTAHFTQEYLGRARHGRYRPAPPDQDPIVCRPSWRPRLIALLDPVGEVVLRLTYGDGMSLEQIERLTRVDRVVLRGAQEGVRGALRALIDEDRLDARSLDLPALDRLLGRVARTPAPDCEGGEELLSVAGLQHAERCPRCARGVRLLRGGVLLPGELAWPAQGFSRGDHVTSVLVLNLHPDARFHRKAVCEQFAGASLRADEDALLIDPDRIEGHSPLLHMLAEQATPRRDHLRGVLVRGYGRWTRAGLIGPVAGAAVELCRARPWGEVDGAGPLPEPLPEPPSAARWWSAALLVTLLAMLVGSRALTPPEPEPRYPISASVLPVEGGRRVRFDVDELAYVLVVVTRDGVPTPLLTAQRPSDKGELATGIGDFIVDPGPGLTLIATSASPFDDVAPLFAAVAGEADPMRSLAERLRVVAPDADVWVESRSP